MSVEVSIHKAQTSILRELLFQPSAGYAKLQSHTDLTSDHFNFHISRLIELGLVSKLNRGEYALTINGKEYANKLDTYNNTIERQPKVAVMLAVSRIKNGVEEFIIQERVKNPNFGFYGFPTGKVKWGETILEAASRECKEETGLDAEFYVEGTYHEHVLFEENDKLAEDKIFFICRSHTASGNLEAEFEGGKNQWMDINSLKKKDKKFKSLPYELQIINSERWFVEKELKYTKSKF